MPSPSPNATAGSTTDRARSVGLFVEVVPEPAGADGPGAVLLDPIAETTVGGDNGDGPVRISSHSLGNHRDNRVIPRPTSRHHPKITKLRIHLPSTRTRCRPRAPARARSRARARCRPRIERRAGRALQDDHHLGWFVEPELELGQLHKQPACSPGTITPPPIRPRPDHVGRIHHDQLNPVIRHPPSLHLPALHLFHLFRPACRSVRHVLRPLLRANRLRPARAALPPSLRRARLQLRTLGVRPAGPRRCDGPTRRGRMLLTERLGLR